MSTKLRSGARKNAAVREASEPAPAIFFAPASGDMRWVHEAPSESSCSSCGHPWWAHDAGGFCAKCTGSDACGNARYDDVRWVHERPATTTVSAFGAGKVAPPGHHTTSTYEAEESVAITVEEASILQSFRPDYPWQGSKTKKFEQIGNAIPPVLAASILAALLEIQP